MFKKTAITGGLSALILLILLAATDPQTLPAGWFVVVFGLLYMVCVCALIVFGLLLKQSGLVRWPAARIRRTAAWAAALPVFLVTLQSIGQLTVQDALLAFGLYVLLYVYINRTVSQSAE